MYLYYENMSQRDDAKNEPEIIESDFPIDSGQEQFEPLLLTVDGHPAKGLITDCLLYTSPSPRDRQKSRMPSSA